MNWLEVLLTILQLPLGSERASLLDSHASRHMRQSDPKQWSIPAGVMNGMKWLLKTVSEDFFGCFALLGSCLSSKHSSI